MFLLVRPTLVIVTMLPPTANAQDSRPPASRPQPSSSAVILKLREEARKLDSAVISQLFSALSDPKVGHELGLTNPQSDLVDRIDKLTREVIKTWLLRDLDAATPPPRDVLEQRLSERGEQFRAQIVQHAEALALQGILTPQQARAWMEKGGRKAEPLLKGRFGPQTVWIPDDDLGSRELAENLQQRARSYSRAGLVFRAILGGQEIGEFLDPKTNTVPPRLAAFARRFMPSIEVAKKQTELADRLNTLTIDVMRAWLTRDLEKTPLPTRDTLRRRLVEYPQVLTSLSAHAEAIALVAILTPVQTDQCLCAIWRGEGVRALLDPTLAARLRLSRSQREEILFVLGEKGRISDAQTEAQVPLAGLNVLHPELRALDERIANDAMDRLEQADGLIWDCLTPAQVRVLSRILDSEKQATPRPVARRKRPGRQG